MAWHPADDTAAIVDAIGDGWLGLRGARLFVTGGTGMIGRPMLAALAEADRRYALGVAATVLTRDPAGAAARGPAMPGLRFVAGDVRTLLPEHGTFTHVIHGATDASADLTARDPQAMFDTCVEGTRRALDLAAASGAGRFLLMSSGAVYGPQPAELPLVAEDWRGGPDCASPASAYAEGKRAAELLAAIAGQSGPGVVTARIFALLGPGLPLGTHFAAGNFIADALAGRRITVTGAGSAVRSYLYLADVAAWLWAALLRAPGGATYNIGSEEGVSIAALAHRVAAVLGAPGVDVLGAADAGWNPGRYVPSTAAIRRDLGVRATVDLDEAIRRTATFNGWTA